ncbi:sensor histidine kinase [Nitrincola sp. A-D6]|uniref:sensor histidine kinase n=1 Tax=Nitrincola sp. A-D6 TaxID=1545442 RepID=UPI00068F2A14|nr:PAS domain-containing sensor histidine kinase [Nitrincola sp. A-D6]
MPSDNNFKTHYLKKELYEKLRQSDELFDFIQQTSLDGLWYWDIQQPEHEWMSERFWQILGYDPAEMPHSSDAWQALVDKDDLAIAQQAIQRHLENPDETFDQILRYRHKNGSTVWIRCRGVMIRDADATPIRMLGTHNDVTQLKQTELSLREQHKALHASNAELEQFAYVTSHDLRQPLRMIKSYLQLLERRLGDDLSDDNRQMLDFAVDGAERLDEMMVSLLEYSRVGRINQSMQTVDLKHCFDEACRFLHSEILASGAQIDIPESAWPVITANADELTRLFQNLLANAIKYAKPRQAPQICITFTRTISGWQCALTDQGIGIDPAQFERLFKVFQRLQHRNVYPGQGVGLALCKKIVQRHGGRIWVTSDGEGQGATFYFSLPETAADERLADTSCVD